MDDKSKPKHFVILLDKTIGLPAPRDTIQRHVDHLKKLNSEGRLVLCGPFSDHPSGLVIVKANDKAEALQIAERDPFVQEGFRTFEVRSWLLANEENNYLA